MTSYQFRRIEAAPSPSYALAIFNDASTEPNALSQAGA